MCAAPGGSRHPAPVAGRLRLGATTCGCCCCATPALLAMTPRQPTPAATFKIHCRMGTGAPPAQWKSSWRRAGSSRCMRSTTSTTPSSAMRCPGLHTSDAPPLHHRVFSAGHCLSCSSLLTSAPCCLVSTRMCRASICSVRSGVRLQTLEIPCRVEGAAVLWRSRAWRFPALRFADVAKVMASKTM